MRCSHDVVGLWHDCVLLWVCGKNHKKKNKIKIIWRKTVAIHNVSKKKTTKLNSHIKKIKSTKIILKNIIQGNTVATYSVS